MSPNESSAAWTSVTWGLYCWSKQWHHYEHTCKSILLGICNTNISYQCPCSDTMLHKWPTYLPYADTHWEGTASFWPLTMKNNFLWILLRVLFLIPFNLLIILQSFKFYHSWQFISHLSRKISLAALIPSATKRKILVHLLQLLPWNVVQILQNINFSIMCHFFTSHLIKILLSPVPNLLDTRHTPPWQWQYFYYTH
jgi:hypothetical protein